MTLELEVCKIDDTNHALEDVVKQTVDVEVTDAVQGHNNNQANTISKLGHWSV